MTIIRSERRDSFPRYRAVAERALLVEFGETIDSAIHDRVLQLDAALASSPFDGFLEAIPAYASLLVCFDPLVTDHRLVRDAVTELLTHSSAAGYRTMLREVDVCYDPDFSPDLESVAEACGLTPEQVIAAHLSGEYSVYMYGFAPGYAYLAGVPASIQVPRKQTAVRDIPAGSVLVAGPQCLITTLKMPTGWWIIGRSPTKILDAKALDRPFLFDVGNTVRFRRVTRDVFGELSR